MRRPLIALGLGLLFTLGACGNDDDGSSDTTVAESTTPSETTGVESEVIVSEPPVTETTVASDDTVISDTTVALADDTVAPTDSASGAEPEAVARRLTDNIKESFGESITSDQADCMTRSMLDRLGADKLVEYDRTDADFEQLPDAEQAAIFETFADCGDVLPQILAGEIMKDGTLTKEQAECVSKGLLETVGVQGLLALAKDSSSVDQETQVKLLGALSTCLPPEVLATIAG